MLLFICLEERIGGGWDGSVNEAWVFLGKIVGSYCFPETYIRWSDIAWFLDTDARWSDIEYCASFLKSPEIWKKFLKILMFW